MTDKELKKLSRKELLEILLEQSKKIDSLTSQLEETNSRLKSREIMIENAGSIAEASLQINEVLKAAQNAADQYLCNVKRLAGEEPEKGESL